MPLIRGQVLSGTTDRTYHIQVPATPPQATVPAIVVFHGGGQERHRDRPPVGRGPPEPGTGPSRELPARLPRGRPPAERRMGAFPKR